MQNLFKSWFLRQVNKETRAELVELDKGSFLKDEIILKVHNSAINYKDALALTGSAPVIRKFPLIPGIDLAGEVMQSTNSLFQEGDYVFATGWGIGEIYHGGLANYASLDADKLIKIPKLFNCSQIMALGTAGLTAMLAILSLEENNILPGSGKNLVTGASGAVGSIAITLLLNLGYEVTCVTTRPIDSSSYLKSLGSFEILDTKCFMEEGKMLSKESWAGCIDTVGGSVLQNIITQMSRSGTVAVCGQVLGIKLNTNLAPFILRGIKLIGIDSAYCSLRTREIAWKRLFESISASETSKFSEVIGITEALKKSKEIIKGQNKRRIVTNNNF